MSDLSQLSSVTVPIDDIVMLVFYFILGAYAIFSSILYYHWQEYGSETKITALTLILYFVSTAPFLVVLTITALTI